jgi:branched-chain amino acid transport system ATP-binding protein
MGKATFCTTSAWAIGEGGIVARLGRNGAGKATTLRSLSALTPLRQGVVRVFGKDATSLQPFRVAGLGVDYVREGRKDFGGPRSHGVGRRE